MTGYTRNGITYNSEDEANLAAAIPGAYLNSLDAGYVAEAILDSDWLAEHDREVGDAKLRDLLAFRFLPTVVREYIDAYLESGSEPDDAVPGGAL